jgi:predicted aspartyl protease
MRPLRLTAFAFAAFCALPAQAQQCQLKQIASLDMTFDPYGRVLVPVSLDDHPHLLMPDTGAPLGILLAETADELGIKKKAMPTAMTFYSESGGKPKAFATVPSLKIGPEEAQFTDFLIGDFGAAGDEQKSPALFAGTLGADILHNFDLDLDFANKKFNLFSQDHCVGKVVYWAAAYTDTPFRQVGGKDGWIGVDMTLDGHPVEGILDTGSARTALNLTDARHSFGIDLDSPGVEKTIVGAGDQQRPIYRYRFKSLVISGITVSNPEMELLPDAVAQQSKRDLQDQRLQGYQGNTGVSAAHILLGADILRRLHLYIAYKEQMLYVTAADAH